MAKRYDDDGPDLREVFAGATDAMRRRLKYIGLGLVLLAVVGLALVGTYSVQPGQVGVVRTFGKESAQTQPGLHFIVPFVQQVDVVDLAKINRVEIGFRATPEGPRRVDDEALMLTGDENIIEAQMIVQWQVQDPSKYLFKLKDPDKTLHIAAEAALRSVVGQMHITSSVESLLPRAATDLPEDDAEAPPAPDDEPPQELTPEQKAKYDPETDILTKGRERAQVRTKEMLQSLMDLYESGIRITEVKLQVVDAPDQVKDAFHDVVRAREESEQMINKALGYREDRLPRARGERQKIERAAEAYKQERVLRAEGDAARFRAVHAEYKKAPAVTRRRLHLETMERIMAKVAKKVVIDKDVAKNALPLLQLGDGAVQGGR
jgi:membrane protease subunit HflK